MDYISIKPGKGREGGEEEEEGETREKKEEREGKEKSELWPWLQAAKALSLICRLQVQGYFCSATPPPNDSVPSLHALGASLGCVPDLESLPCLCAQGEQSHWRKKQVATLGRAWGGRPCSPSGRNWRKVCWIIKS